MAGQRGRRLRAGPASGVTKYTKLQERERGRNRAQHLKIAVQSPQIDRSVPKEIEVRGSGIGEGGATGAVQFLAWAIDAGGASSGAPYARAGGA